MSNVQHFAFAPSDEDGERVGEYEMVSSEMDACEMWDNNKLGGFVRRITQAWHIGWASGVTTAMPEIPSICTPREALAEAQAMQDKHEAATGEKDTAVWADERAWKVEYDFGGGYEATEAAAVRTLREFRQELTEADRRLVEELTGTKA